MSKTIIVTGSSRGIGAATARLAAKQGYAVCVNYRAEKAQAEAVAHDIEQAGSKAIVVQGDMAVEGDIVRLFETCDRELGALDGLVNNAGITGRTCRVDEIDAATLKAVMDLNITGSFLCAREAVRRMSTKHGGKGARSSTCRRAPPNSACLAPGCTTRRRRGRSTPSPSVLPRRWPARVSASTRSIPA